MKSFPRVSAWMLAAAVILGCFMPIASMAQTGDSTAVAPTDTLSAPAPGTAQATTPPPAATPPAQTTSAAPAPTEEAGMFSKGRRRVSGTVGWGSSFGSDYLLVGLGVGYFVANGLTAGLDFEGWFLGDPTMYKVSPRLDYVVWRSPRMKPYFGGFYRYNFITDFDDQSSLGGRAGVFYKGTRGGMAGAGAVYEKFLDCEFGACDTIYPEIFVTLSF